MVWALVIAAIAPVGIVAVDEAVGTRHRAEALLRLQSGSAEARR